MLLNLGVELTAIAKVESFISIPSLKDSSSAFNKVANSSKLNLVLLVLIADLNALNSFGRHLIAT